MNRSAWPSLLLLAALLAFPGRGAPPLAAEGDPDGLALLDEMTEAHGGMEAWASAPTVSFRETWYKDDPSAGTTSRVVVEQGDRRAVMDMESGGSAVWNGTEAWSVDWKAPTPPRFVIELTYYFVSLPWVVHDPGVVVGAPEKNVWLPGDPNPYDSVLITFGEGVGDTPGDYYRLYLDARTHRLEACEYVVTYAALLPPGVEHTTPHLLRFDQFETVHGLLVPARFTIYDGETVYANCAVRDWSFSEPFDASRMQMPAGAVPDTTSPTRE